MKKLIGAAAFAFVGLVAYEFVKAIIDMDDEQIVHDQYGYRPQEGQ